MTASLGKGISIAIVGAFFGWNAGLFGPTLNSLNPALADYLPDFPLWGCLLIVLASMIVMPSLYRLCVGLTVLCVGGWLSWQGLSAVI